MDIKDSYLHGTVGVVKSISVNADKLTYRLADQANTPIEVTLPTATKSANGLLSSTDKTKLDSLNGGSSYQNQVTVINSGSETVVYKKVTITKNDLDGYGIWIHSRSQHYLLNSGAAGMSTIKNTFWELGTNINSTAVSTTRGIRVKMVATASSATVTLYIAMEAYTYFQVISSGIIKVEDSTKDIYDGITSSTTGWVSCNPAKWSDTTYNIVNNSANGLAPKVISTNTTIGNTYYLLASSNGSAAPSWYKLPATAFSNDDTKVTQTNTTSNSTYRVLFSSTADDTTRTEGARKSTNLKFNPSTGTLESTYVRASGFKGTATSLEDLMKSGLSLTYNRFSKSSFSDETGITVSGNANGILWVGTHGPEASNTSDIGYGHMLGFVGGGGALYHKVVTNGDTSGSWRQIAYTTSDITGNAASADKLKTARKLWGQDFDGSADVSGDMTDVGNINSIFKVTQGSGNAKLNVHSVMSDRDYLSLYVSSNTSTNTTTRPLVLQYNYGNVGIGVVAPSEKLEVNGNVKATSFLGNLDGTYVNKLTGYTKATAIVALDVEDSLNTALGKLEYKTDFIYNDLIGGENNANVIDKWSEIKDFIAEVGNSTDITDVFVTRKTAQIITGQKTFNQFLRFVPNTTGGHAYGISNIDSDGDNKTKLTAGIGFLNNSGIFTGAYIGWGESPWNSANNLYVNDSTFTYKNYKILHANNSHITNGVITINGVSITPLTEHQSLADYLPLAGGTMKKDAYISWNASEYGDSVSDWSTITGHGLRIISSTSENSNAPTTYCTALHIRGSYGFKIASQGGATSNKFFIQNISNGAWNELIHSSNYETILNAKYLPLSGGTLTGTLISRQIKPSSNNSYSLGTSDRKWSSLYATNIYSNAIYNGSSIYASGEEIIHGGSDYFELNKGYPNAIMWLNASEYKFKLGSDGVQFMIAANGNVGIGDVGGAPAYKLHVGGGEIMADTVHAWSGGFKKNGSSDSYVLLGGGGHKHLTTFFTSLSSDSTNAISITIGGTTKSISKATLASSLGSLKNPYSIKFKNIENTEVSYDGSSAVDLTGGLYYAKIAGQLNSTALITDKKFTSLTNASWTDTGYTFTELESGTYAIQVTSDNLVASGIMSVYTNIEDSIGDEIPLHVYGTAGWRPYLRTSAKKLQISSNDVEAAKNGRTVTIKIAKIL